jgi:NAD(P)H-dependent flavin oxidoreductase YrpB (nitropropane dioxygenase family)
MKNSVTEILGCEYPVIQGGMAWVAEHHLAAAVSEAGGFGIIGAVLTSGGRQLLQDAGTVSHRQALEKAQAEYRKFQAQTLSPVEEAYLETVKGLEKTAKKKNRETKQ